MFYRGSGSSLAINGISHIKIAGITAAVQGGETRIPHGLLLADIVGWHSNVLFAATRQVSQGHTTNTSFEFQVIAETDDMVVQLDATESGSLLSVPVEILIWHRGAPSS